MTKWLPIPGYEKYIISDSGKVRTTRRVSKYGRLFQAKVLRQDSKNGYKAIGLYNDNGRKSKYIHRLVLSTFVGQCPKGNECNHKDGDKLNNKLNNLEWCTKSDNIKHAIKNGFIKIVGRPFKKGRKPWNKIVNRTCIECHKRDSIVARRLCRSCWQRIRYLEKKYKDPSIV